MRVRSIAALTLGGLFAPMALGFSPNDPLFPSQWGLVTTRATEAWDVMPTAPRDTVVAIIDGGVDLEHPDLRDRLWTASQAVTGPPACGAAAVAGVGSHGYDLVDCDDRPNPEPMSDGSRPEPGYSHGTKMAGIVGASVGNGAGIAGVNPWARIMPIRVCGSAPTSCSQLKEIEAIAWAGAAGARVVNMSLGGPGTSAVGQSRLRAAFDTFPNTLYVISAGNDGLDLDDPAGANNAFPCEIPAENVICVANLSRTDTLAPSSNFGAVSVDIAAPGASIATTTPTDAVVPNYATGSGTSEAAPHVAGVASLLMSAFPNASAAEVKQAILSSARPLAALTGQVASAGALDARAALDALRARRPPPATIPTPIRPPTVGTLVRRPLGHGRVRVTFPLSTAGALTTWRILRIAGGATRQLASGRRVQPGNVGATLRGRPGDLFTIVLTATNAAGRLTTKRAAVRIKQ